MSEKGLIQSLNRGLEILRHVSRAPNGLRLYELAEQMQLGRTTLHNIAKTLIANGFLVQDAETRYKLGSAIDELYTARKETVFLNLICQKIKAYNNHFPERSLFYSEPQNGDIFTRAYINYSSHGVVQRPWDSLLAPYYTAAGLVAFAFGNDDTRFYISQKHAFSSEGLNVWNSQERFSEEVEKTKKLGYAIFPFDKDSSRIAAPILINNQLIGTFTLTVHQKLGPLPESDKEKKEVLNSLFELIKEISQPQEL